MNVSSFVNKEISIKNGKYNFTIVGVADTNENTVYMNKWAIFDFVPSDLRKNGVKVISESEFEKYDNIKLNLEKDDELEIKEKAGNQKPDILRLHWKDVVYAKHYGQKNKQKR